MITGFAPGMQFRAIVMIVYDDNVKQRGATDKYVEKL